MRYKIRVVRYIHSETQDEFSSVDIDFTHALLHDDWYIDSSGRGTLIPEDLSDTNNYEL